MAKYFYLTLLVLVLFGLHVSVYRHPAFPLDDAYITLHNAATLAGAPELNYAGTPALAGSTSVAQTVVVAALSLLFSPIWALTFVTWAGILAYVLALAYLADVHKLPWWATALLLIVGMLAGLMTYQLLNGLETGMAMAALTLGLALASRPQPSRALCVLCGTMPFLRPELIVIAVLLMAMQLRRRLKNGDNKQAITDTSLVLASGAIWLLVLYVNTGHLHPLTIDAKRYFFAAGLLPVHTKMTSMGFAGLGFILETGIPLVAALPFVWSSPVGKRCLLFIGAFLVSYFVQFPHGFWYNGHRYLYLLLPIMLLGIVTGISSTKRDWRIGATVMLCLAAAQALILLPSHWSIYRTGIWMATVEYADVAAFCNEHLPPGSRILIHDAGYMSYATKFPLTDMVGLKTPSSIEFHKQLTYPSNGKERSVAISKIATASHANYLIVIGHWEPMFHISDGLRSTGWSVEPVRVPNSSNPFGLRAVDGFDHYTIFRISRKAELSGLDNQSSPERERASVARQDH